MLRKRRNPTPGFNLPTPFQPITGERAPLIQEGVSPHCAMMQVAAEDIYDDYVICRGYDPRDKRFYEYDESDPNKPGIPVAKPYGNRKPGAYRVGQIFPAVIPLTRLGQNPGVSETSNGHPSDLDEIVELLYTDDDSKAINWLIINTDTIVEVGVITARPQDGEDPPIIKVNLISADFPAPVDSSSSSESYDESTESTETEVYWMDCPRASGGGYNGKARLLIECGQRILIANYGGQRVAIDVPLVTVRKGFSTAGTVKVYAPHCPDDYSSSDSDSDTDEFGDYESASWPIPGETANGHVWCIWTGLAWMVLAAACDYDPQSSSGDSSYDSDDPTESEWLV